MLVLILACRVPPVDPVDDTDIDTSDVIPDTDGPLGDCEVVVGAAVETAWGCVVGIQEHELLGNLLVAMDGRLATASDGPTSHEEGTPQGPVGRGYVVSP